MDRQPTLDGPTLHLRPLEEADWAALYAVASDPLIWAVHPAHDRWREPVFREFFEGAISGGGALAVIDRASGRIVGSSRFQGYEPANGGSVEIGWTFLSRACWGGDTNRELKRLMLGHALNSVERVLFRVGEQNLRSRGAMEKIGGRLTDRRDDVVMNGTVVPHVIYEISREDFRKGPLARA
ncbi:GNAT family N-acetyltransferase [Novosphingobium tardum]|uniref:GNAT family N-acetyltransferase n=1 Tax=Novosphingobium tardum TaxID=1538021 RepID=A0ABV8RRW4_9SPHN